MSEKNSMNCVRRKSLRLAFIYIAAIVSVTAITRFVSQPHSNSQSNESISNPDLTSMDEMMAQMREAERLMHAPDAVNRAYGAARLGTFGSKAATHTASLVHALKDSDVWVRVAAAQSLGCIGSPASRAVPDLIRIIQDSDSRVRCRAIEALGKIGPSASSAIATLMHIQKTSPYKERVIIAAALRRISSPSSISVAGNLRSPAFTPIVPPIMEPIPDGQPTTQPMVERSVRPSAYWAEMVRIE